MMDASEIETLSALVSRAEACVRDLEPDTGLPMGEPFGSLVAEARSALDGAEALALASLFPQRNPTGVTGGQMLQLQWNLDHVRHGPDFAEGDFLQVYDELSADPAMALLLRSPMVMRLWLPQILEVRHSARDRAVDCLLRIKLGIAARLAASSSDEYGARFLSSQMPALRSAIDRVVAAREDYAAAEVARVAAAEAQVEEDRKRLLVERRADLANRAGACNAVAYPDKRSGEPWTQGLALMMRLRDPLWVYTDDQLRAIEAAIVGAEASRRFLHADAVAP